MRQERADLKQFLNSRSLVIVGVSSDFSRFTGRTLKYPLKHGYEGNVSRINPKYGEILYLPFYSSVSDLPEAVDISLIHLTHNLKSKEVVQ